MARRTAARLAIALALVSATFAPLLAQGAGIGGAAPSQKRNSGEPGQPGPSTEPSPGQAAPSRGPQGRERETEAPQQFDNGGCQYRERKLELIV